jgi:hypothetical protein
VARETSLVQERNRGAPGLYSGIRIAPRAALLRVALASTIAARSLRRGPSVDATAHLVRARQAIAHGGLALEPGFSAFTSSLQLIMIGAQSLALASVQLRQRCLASRRISNVVWSFRSGNRHRPTRHGSCSELDAEPARAGRVLSVLHLVRRRPSRKVIQ